MLYDLISITRYMLNPEGKTSLVVSKTGVYRSFIVCNTALMQPKMSKYIFLYSFIESWFPFPPPRPTKLETTKLKQTKEHGHETLSCHCLVLN